MVEVESRPREGKSRCPYCHEDLAIDAPKVECEKCGAPHHADCFHSENRGCSVMGCGSTTTRGAAGLETVPARPRSPAMFALMALYLFGCLALIAAGAGSSSGKLVSLGALGIFGLLVAGIGSWYERAIARAVATRREEIPPDVLPAPSPPLFMTPGLLEAQNPYNVMKERIREAAANDPPVEAPEKPRTGPLPGKCPSCNEAVDAEQDVRFCYHCGDPLD